MWDSLINTIGGFAKLAGRHHQQWARLIFNTAPVFLAIGIAWGMMTAGVVAYFLFQEADQPIQTTNWLSYSIRYGWFVMLMGCGLIAGAFSRDKNAPESFQQLAKGTPREAWSQFFISMLILSVTFSLEMYLSLAKTYSFSMDAGMDERSTYLVYNWGVNASYAANVLLMALFTGIVFIKAAGGPAVAPYKRNLKTMAITGFFLVFIIGGIYYQFTTLVISPIITLLVSQFAKEGAESPVFISILTDMLLLAVAVGLSGGWTWLVCGAFYEEEEEFELEESNRATIQ